MEEIVSCPKCKALFVRNKFRNYCDNCYKDEEKMFDKVSHFLKKRDDRMATLDLVIKETGIEEDLLIKSINQTFD